MTNDMNEVPNILARLSEHNAYRVAAVMHRNHVEWGVKQFHFKAQELTNGSYAHVVGGGSNSAVITDVDEWNVTAWLPDGAQLAIRIDTLSRATRDAAEKFTADAIAAGKEFKPEGFREYPEDYFDATELQDSDSYRDFVDALNQE